MSGAPLPKPEFSRTVLVEALRDHGGAATRADATEAECDTLAARFGVLAVRALGFEAEVAPWGPGGWRVTGRVRAGLTQTCVVTLEPVDTELDEPFERFFAPPRRLEEAQALLDDDAEEEAEALGPAIDLGEIAAETAALGLDPYPRRADAAFEGRVQGPPDAEPLTDEAARPFARLSALKRPGEEG
jgi:uncharacterized metal-binding protein YceD (DUF177 family)